MLLYGRQRNRARSAIDLHDKHGAAAGDIKNRRELIAGATCDNAQPGVEPFFSETPGKRVRWQSERSSGGAVSTSPSRHHRIFAEPGNIR
jgi:hypothetical protein